MRFGGVRMFHGFIGIEILFKRLALK